MRMGKRGKEKLPATSSITFTWQRYKPGFSDCSGRSIWKVTALRSGEFISLRVVTLDSKTFAEFWINSTLEKTRTASCADFAAGCDFGLFCGVADAVCSGFFPLAGS